MIRFIIISCLIAGLTGFAISKPVRSDRPQKPGKISADTQGKIDKIKDQAKSTDWAGIKEEYRSIDWKDGDAIESLKAIAKELPKNKNIKELRREMKTKYLLLREGTNDILGLEDVEAYNIPVIRLSPIILSILDIQCLDIIPLSMPGIEFETFDILTLNPDTLKMLGITIPVINPDALNISFISIANAKWEQAMATWGRRWNIAIDAIGVNNIRVIPDPKTALGQQRAKLMRVIEVEGWTKETETAWSQYYNNLTKALVRRNLRKKR